MGSLLSKSSSEYEDHYKSVYRVKAKETAAMKKIWMIVENDLSYYSSTFSTILFRNHPQYVKYFHEDNIPEFVQDARIKKKFSAVCTIVSALFIDYSKKRHQRDHLLGYIAMIHKDMQLTSQDLENFMMDLVELLIQERPAEMTAECTLVHMRYFSGLLKRIGYLMEVQREKDLYNLEDDSVESQRCGCMSLLCESPSIYGRSRDYWITKKHYWQLRMAVWSSLDQELSGMSSFLSTTKIDSKAHYPEAVKHDLGKRPSSLVAKNRRNTWRRQAWNLRTSVTSSETGYNDSRTMHTWFERCKKNRRRYRRNLSTLTSARRMEPIPEVRSRQIIAPPVESPSMNVQAFPNVMKAPQATKVYIESAKSTARSRKRSRDRKRRISGCAKGNAIHPSTASDN